MRGDGLFFEEGFGCFEIVSKIIDFIKKVDENQVCFYYSFVSARWLAILIENIGNVITFMVAIFALNSGGNVSPSQVGLIMVYALNVTMTLNMLVVSTSDIETNIVAVERIMEYGNLIQEATWDSKEEQRPPKGWPDKGQITFDKYDTNKSNIATSFVSSVDSHRFDE